MPEKELSDFEATIVLRRALTLNKITLDQDPLFKELESARFEMEMTKYGFFAAGATMNLLILYSFRYKTKLPWDRVIGRLCAVTAFWTFFYCTSPGVRRYNDILINISRGKKKDLLHLFDP